MLDSNLLASTTTEHMLDRSNRFIPGWTFPPARGLFWTGRMEKSQLLRPEIYDSINPYKPPNIAHVGPHCSAPELPNYPWRFTKAFWVGPYGEQLHGRLSRWLRQKPGSTTHHSDQPQLMCFIPCKNHHSNEFVTLIECLTISHCSYLQPLMVPPLPGFRVSIGGFPWQDLDFLAPRVGSSPGHVRPDNQVDGQEVTLLRQARANRYESTSQLMSQWPYSECLKKWLIDGEFTGVC